VIASLSLAGWPQSAVAVDPHELLAKALRRHELLDRIDVEVVVTIGPYIEPAPADPAQVLVQRVRIAQDGKTWCLRYLEDKRGGAIPAYTICREEGLFTFGTQPPNSDSKHTLLIEKRREFRLRDRAERWCLDLGGFWHSSLREHLRKSSLPAKYLGQETVADTECHVIEIPMTPRDVYSGFHAIQSYSLAKVGGSLRVWISPALQFAVPRYEYRRLDQAVDTRFNCSRFVNQGDYYYPQDARIEIFPESAGGDPRPMTQIKYEVTKVHSINAAVPKSLFKVTVPPNTRISDTRGEIGAVAFYGADRITTPRDFDSWLRDVRAQPGLETTRGWSRVQVVWISVVLVAVTALLVWWRSRRGGS
jgi:hypothetical protein